MASKVEVEEEWGTTAEKSLCRFLSLTFNDPLSLQEVRTVQSELLKPPLMQHMDRLAKQCGLSIEVFALATASVIVFEEKDEEQMTVEGQKQITTVANHLGGDPNLHTAVIGQRLFAAVDRYYNH